MSLYAKEFGHHGTPLLLLHGLGGGVSTWQDVASKLAPHYHILVPDLLGFGRSPWPKVEYTLDDHLTALEQLLEERSFVSTPINIAGHSMGAILAAELAVRHPEIISSVALVSFPYFHSRAEVRDIAKRLGFLARLTVADHWAARATCGVMCALRPVLISLAPRFTRRVPAPVARDALRHNFTSYSQTLQNVVVRHRVDPTLTALVERRVLLVHGEVDRVVPVDNIRALAAEFPKWQFEEISGAGHLLPIEEPDLLASLLNTRFSLLETAKRNHPYQGVD